ncbi:MAG: sigma-54-dependent transcriptional regulator [Casimicrobiaceae bacterium]
MKTIDLLIVDDDEMYRSMAVRHFSRRGYRPQDAADGEAALQLAARRKFGVAVIDLAMPGLSGLETMVRLKARTPDCEVVMLSGEGTIETAVEAMKRGACDFLTKPFPLPELEVVVQKASDQRQLRQENRQLKAVIERRQPPSEIIGRSAALAEVLRLVERAGPSDKAILIQGETGTGKELIAQALHRASQRADKPMIVINCAALPETLLESELFGHEKGSFTGAVHAKQGLFELADGSTLMIDEVGEMPGPLQAKLLRVLEDGSFRRVGSLQECHVDVRLLAATNRNLAQEVKAGRFREDLYYRINVMSLELPPLRHRRGDVPLLVERFLGPSWRIEHEAVQALEQYSWPGNVRQLINVIERAKILAEDFLVRLDDLPAEMHFRETQPARHGDGGGLEQIERAHVVDVLEREQGNKVRAARALGINRRSLYRLLKRHGIA